MKRTARIITLLTLISCAPCFGLNIGDASDNYFPVALGDAWTYTGYMKAKPDEKLDVKAEVVEKREIGGKEYFFYSAPGLGLRYFVRKDTDGVFMKIIKYPFSIFNFLIEVDLEPEMKVISFPLEVGKKWEYKGTGTATILGIFKITREIKGIFEVADTKKKKTPYGEIKSYCIVSSIDEGDGKGFKKGEHWYGKDTGYLVSITDTHYAELVDVKLIQ